MRTLSPLTLGAGAVLGLPAWLGPLALSHLGSRASLASDPQRTWSAPGTPATRASVFSGDGA